MSGRKLLLMLFVLSLTAGCSGKYSLVSLGIESGSGPAWTSYSPPRMATYPLEVAILEAAQNRSSVSEVGVDVMYVAEENEGQLVAVVEWLAAESDFFSEREVTRYKVVDGMLAGRSSTEREMFPSVEFERAVIMTAKKAGTSDPVTLYQGDIKSVTMAGRTQGKCSAVVNIYDDQRGGRSQPRAQKKVTLCY